EGAAVRQRDQLDAGEAAQGARRRHEDQRAPAELRELHRRVEWDLARRLEQLDDRAAEIEVLGLQALDQVFGQRDRDRAGTPAELRRAPGPCGLADLAIWRRGRDPVRRGT